MELYLKGFLIALKGAPMTVGVCIFAIILGTSFGLLLAFMKIAKFKLWRIISSIYIEIVRGTPMIVQALIVAFGIPFFLQSHNIEFKWENLIIPAMLVCGLNSAAYMAEIIRGGLQAVDKGQIEAAKSIGMSKKQVSRLILIPQAFRIVIPSIGNEFVTLIKETAVLSFVGVVEILRNAQLWNASSFETFPAYIGAAMVYLILTLSVSKGFSFLEKKLDRKG